MGAAYRSGGVLGTAMLVPMALLMSGFLAASAPALAARRRAPAGLVVRLS